MNALNNTFPSYFQENNENNMEVEIGEKSNLSVFHLNFLKFSENNIVENLNVNENLNNNSNNFNNYNNNFNNTCNNINFSTPKKKNTLDMSYSMEQTFCENSHMNLEEEFQQQNEEPYLKIGNEGQNPCIDPIQEVDSFERENNESFIHENNYLFDNFNDHSNSFEGSSNGIPSDLFKLDLTTEDTEIHKMRQNILSLKQSKTNINKTDINIKLSNGNSNRKPPMFMISNNNLSTSNIVNNCNTINKFNNKLNLSCNLSGTFLNSNKKRGRKKLLLDGIKTEILDKAFLREFKCYLKKSKKQKFKNVCDELTSDEKIFWNEFFQNNYPPFTFTKNNNKIEFKSFSKSLLKFVFSHQSVRQLYSLFVKEKEKEIVNSIVNKKIKKIERRMLVFYTFYGKNLHKLYSNDYNASDLNIEEIDFLGMGSTSSTNGVSNIFLGSTSSTNGVSNISDSIIINTSIDK